MKLGGLWVTIVFVGLSYGSGYIETYTPDFIAIGVGEHYLNLMMGALDQTAKAIGTVALTIGLALPSILNARKPMTVEQERDELQARLAELDATIPTQN